MELYPLGEYAKQERENCGALIPPALCFLTLGVIALFTALSIGSVQAAHTPLSAYPPASATPACVPVWVTVDAPRPGALNGLAGLSVLSANDIWAVGYYKETFNGPPRNLTMHWNGAQWSEVPSPNIGTDTNRLWGVAAITPNDVWAVGQYAALPGVGRGMTMHWDGIQWNIMPNPGLDGSFLYGISAVSSNDVWAVGYLAGRPYTLHWNGSSWENVPAPYPPDIIVSSLRAVTAIAPNDVWAVGNTLFADSTFEPLTMHWNGTEWGLVSSPNPNPAGNDLRGVSAISTTDVWAIGNYRNSNPYYSPLFLRWNGSAWNQIPGPDLGTQSFIQFYGISAVSGDDVWAVGHRTLHWDGTGWIMAYTGQREYDPLYAVEAVSTNDVWAVGEENSFSQGGQVLIKRYTGQCTVGTPTPNPISTVTPTATATVTASSTSIATPSISSTPTSISTGTAVPSGTVTPHTPTPTNTSLPQTATPCSVSFTDVPSGSTFHPFIMCLACRGIVSGYSDGTFRPNNQVTRGQLAKIVSNSAGFTEPPTQQTFEDVPPTNTFYEWIERLTIRGYMTGYNCGSVGEPCITGKPYFRPFANATRGQTAKIVSNAAGFTEPPVGQTFEDVSPTHTFYEFIQRLATRSVMGGYPCGGPNEPCVTGRPYFRPGNDVTRGQSSKIVANAFYPDCSTP